MIKNERQFRITKSHAEKFREALKAIEREQSDKNIHPLLIKAQKDALRSQIYELDEQLNEYEALRDGKYTVLELNSFDELPLALIKARIAGGLSQKDLAERLGLKEQQIQRYEATEFESVSLSRLRDIISALGITVRDDIFLANANLSFSNIFTRLKEIGLDEVFAKRRILPKEYALERKDVSQETIVLKSLSRISRIFGVSIPDILNAENSLTLNKLVFGSTRFKTSKRINEQRLNAYTIYAHYLALLILEATKHLLQKPVPTDPQIVSENIKNEFGEISLESALRYVWSLGIPVLPLDDSGAFHGACWRINGRNVIALKQKNKSWAKWVFDLIHELDHTGHNPDEANFVIIEENETLKDRYESDEEILASQFAGDVVLNLRAEELVDICVNEAKGDVKFLKRVVPQVANREGVAAELLANYMAFRLMLQGINWWGAATNLQSISDNPLEIAKKIFFEKVDLSVLNPIDREILLQSLAED